MPCVSMIHGSCLMLFFREMTAGKTVVMGRKTLESLPLEEYQKACSEFDEGVYGAISLEKCVNGRTVYGGPAPDNVKAQAEEMLKRLEEI